MLIAVWVLFAGLLVAYANGANDNFKGVATLFGSGITDYKRALYWATATTLLGSLAALFFSKGLVTAFSGKGLVPASLVQTPALVGGLVGAGLASAIIADRFRSADNDRLPHVSKVEKNVRG